MQRRLRWPVIVLALTGTVAAHDLFLKFDTYFLTPKTKSSVALVNGVFERSDNVITRDRMIDVSVVGPGPERMHPELSQWRDEGVTSWLDFTTGEAGTYTLGVSTHSRIIELNAEKFHGYLRHDGVLDILEDREQKGLLEKGARERYSKHVKAIVQVGDARSAGWNVELGYPIEIVPRSNPYEVEIGQKLKAAVLVEGKPLPNQLVYASHEFHHQHDADGGHVEIFSGRTDAAGEFEVPISRDGRWYVRLIRMVESSEENVDYESSWATLTFEVPEPDQGGIATRWVALIVALVFVGLVAWSRRGGR